MKFKKLVGIEPLELIPSANKKLESFAETLILHEDQPSTAEEIVKRIGDADGVLVSHRSTIGKDIFGTMSKYQIHWDVLLPLFSGKR
ncbi:hypothetical protein M8845_10750 [Gelidibacter japonicus]|uniref:hypothetical protein n=1 Tax=Gelidibacter japonicus TaxID=1962232 RepID=UPI0020221136|nr:hypothetical protein [Gelidibacter japonicus]MCL8007905.1 hypothetical protein [Gelidibacter japonicus]